MRLLLIVLLSVASAGAHAASLEIAGDTIVLKALGERMVFPRQLAPHVQLTWPVDACADKTHGAYPSLADWLHDPALAECLNKAIPDARAAGARDYLVLAISFIYEDGKLMRDTPRGQPLRGALLPGDIRPNELPPHPRFVSALGDIWIGINRAAGPDCASPATGPVDAMGYQKLGVGILRKADRRPDSSRDLCMHCFSQAGPRCNVHLRSRDAIVDLSVAWEEPRAEPNEASALYDLAVRKMARSIFPDRPKDDIE